MTIGTPIVVSGELITSAWGNQVRADLLNLDGRIPKLFACTTSTGNAAVGSGLTNVAAVTVPSQSVAGIVLYTAITLINSKTVATDVFDVIIYTLYDSTARATVRTLASGSTALSIAVPIPAGTAASANLNAQRSSGTGTANFSGDIRYSRIDALWVPA